MNPDPNASPQGGLTGEVRFRVPLPIIVPFGALLVIAALTIGFSRILLSVPHEIATVVAMVTAANVVGACAVVALRRNMNRSSISELLIVVLYPVLVGAVIASMNLDAAAHGGEVAHGGNGGGEPAPSTGAGTVVASGSAFDKDTLELTAGETTQIELVNEDTVPHNISVYEDDSAQQLIFEGDEVIDDSITYEIEAPAKPGEAYFQCDFHPNMNGTVTIK